MEIEGFILQNRLGSGSFGEIWEAIEKKSQKQVALKMIKDKSMEKKDYHFKNEIRVLSRI